MSQQCVTTFTRKTFTKQANLHHIHNCRNPNIIRVKHLLQLWRKVLELLKLYHGFKKNANNFIDTFTKVIKSSQVLVMLFLQPNHHSKATNMQMIIKERLERHLEHKFCIYLTYGLIHSSVFSIGYSFLSGILFFGLHLFSFHFSSPFHFFTPI